MPRTEDLDDLVHLLIEDGMHQIESREVKGSWRNGVTPQYLRTILRADHGIVATTDALLASLDRLAARGLIHNKEVGHLGWGFIQPVAMRKPRRIAL